MTRDEVAVLRENLGTLVDRMDDFLPAPTVEAGWVLEASGELGRQARAIDRVLALHQPQRLSVVYALGQPVLDDFCTSCTSAGDSPAQYPCATVQAIEGAS